MSEPTLYVRTDMNREIATGHIMRCLAIANAAKEFGCGTTFLLADNQAAGVVQQHGCQTIVLHTKWNDMEGELYALQSVIDERNIKLLLIDSYMVTAKYLQVLSQKVRVAYIDDLNAFLYPVDILICYASYWKKFCYEERYKNAKLLLGPQYVPLRPAYRNCKRRPIKARIENLLLMSGGTDNFCILERLLQRIKKERYQEIHVICGTYYADYEQICRRYEQYKNVHFHKSVNHMEQFMIQADLAVSAGGTTLYELCACGTPAISYSFADNQLDNVKQFQAIEIIDYAGDVRNTDIFHNISCYLDTYDKNVSLRTERSIKMREFVDGDGAKRIAGELIRFM